MSPDTGFGAEQMPWVEPPDDSAMQDAIHRALTRPMMTVGEKSWICGVCRFIVTKAHFKRHLKKHDREGVSRARVDAAWREFVERGKSD